MRSSNARSRSRGSAMMLERGHLDPRVVVAGAPAEVGVMARGEGGDGLAVVTGAHPRAVEAAHHSGTNGVGHLEGQVHLAQLVPHADHDAVLEAAGPWLCAGGT